MCQAFGCGVSLAGSLWCPAARAGVEIFRTAPETEKQGQHQLLLKTVSETINHAHPDFQMTDITAVV